MFDVLALTKESLPTPHLKSHNRLELSSVSEKECGERACHSACWRLDCRDHRHSRWRYDALSPLIGLREPSRLPSKAADEPLDLRIATEIEGRPATWPTSRLNHMAIGGKEDT